MASPKKSPVYPLSVLRAVVLHTQKLVSANPPSTPEALVDLVKALGYIQIDTLHVVQRAHYLTLWGRIGAYNTTEFDRLIYTSGARRLYEGWGHAASIIPLEHYRYHRWRTDPKISFNPGFETWINKEGHRRMVEQIMERVGMEGGLRVGDFEYDGPQRGDWYDWKPSKMALEALFAWGNLMVADRVNFQRVYDIKERVLPDWVDTTPVDTDAGRRFCLELAARALGVFEAKHLTFYAYMRATPARALVRELIDEGILVEIRGEVTTGAQKWLVHRDNLPLLERAADGEVKAERTTFLSPFDSLFWAADRDEKLWGFRQLLECYKPAADRVYGYYSLPILYRDRLIGRFDPKLDRKSGVMTLNALYLEPGIAPEGQLVKETAAAMRNFMAWHGAKELEIVKSEPADFGASWLQDL